MTWRGDKDKMVFNGQLITALRAERVDFMLDFFESALDSPSCGAVFDHLFRRQFKVGRKERKREVAVINRANCDWQGGLCPET